MMQEKGYTSEYIFHRQTDENWSSSKAGVQPGLSMLQCFNLYISCCLADSSARNQTVKIQFSERIRCLRIGFLETSTLSMKLFTLPWRNHRREEKRREGPQSEATETSVLSSESAPQQMFKPVNPLLLPLHLVSLPTTTCPKPPCYPVCAQFPLITPWHPQKSSPSESVQSKIASARETQGSSSNVR